MSNYTTFIENTGNTNTSINVTGLTNDRYYQFKVSARNSEGVGLPAETITAVAPRIAPTAPTNVVGSAGNAQSVVSWTASNVNGGSAIAGYKVEYAPDPYSSWTEAVASTSSSPYTVTGLTNGTNYRFRVTGTNQFVTGPTSDPSSTITPLSFQAIAKDGNGTVIDPITYTTGGITYKTHVFTSSGDLEVTGTKNIDFLIVGGGGAGGRRMGGGGGGGGVISGTDYPLILNGDLVISVGNGAARHNDPGSGTETGASDGTESFISGLDYKFEAPGGGAGGSSWDNTHKHGKDGGSGGGESGFVATDQNVASYAKYVTYNASGVKDESVSWVGGTYTIVSSKVFAYGHRGGDKPYGEGAGTYYPTGGGGAGTAGTNNTTSLAQPPHGGDGKQISWATPEALGVTTVNHGVISTTPFYWAGGGGGSKYSDPDNTAPYMQTGDGGKGGGGYGAGSAAQGTANQTPGNYGEGGFAVPPTTSTNDGNGGDAGDNTGSGGGGMQWPPYSPAPTYPMWGGAGGSGIVVIRYAM